MFSKYWRFMVITKECVYFLHVDVTIKHTDLKICFIPLPIWTTFVVDVQYSLANKTY